MLGYVELHIEQGPVLEAEDLPLGVVTAINGAARYNATVRGMAGHAGTVPMDLRHDALAAAAEMVLAVERCAAGAARAWSRPSGSSTCSPAPSTSSPARCASPSTSARRTMPTAWPRWPR